MSQPQHPESSSSVWGEQPVYPVYADYGQPSFTPPYAGMYGAAAVRQSQRTNGFAIAALILGVLACSPLALPFAIVALIQTRSGRQRGRELAIGALIASAVWIVITVVAFATGALRFTAFAGSSLPAAGGSPAGVMSAGDCIDNLPSLAPGITTHVDKIVTVSCDRPHDAQVMAYAKLPVGPWPGNAAAVTDANQACNRVLASALTKTPGDIQVHIAFVAPDSASSWNASHSAACLFVRATDQKLSSRIG